MPDSAPIRRLLCSDLVSIARRSGRGALQAIRGNLEEIGERSALVLADAAIAPGTSVTVACEAHELKGIIKSCRCERLLGFFVEVQLTPEYRQSERWFTPEHVLRLIRGIRA